MQNTINETKPTIAPIVTLSCTVYNSRRPVLIKNTITITEAKHNKIQNATCPTKGIKVNTAPRPPIKALIKRINFNKDLSIKFTVKIIT